MVDKPKCDQLLSRLDQYLKTLEELAHVPRAEFLANQDKIGNAKYHFVVAIEVCIDIANHMIASERFRVPRDNADSFAVLIENGVLPENGRSSCAAMARFRNRLVHLYWNVDDGLVYDYLQNSLPELRSVLARLAAFSAGSGNETAGS